MSETNKGIYEYFSQVKEQPVDWLWYPYIPCGKLTLLQGDPGEGKSTFMLNIAALLTRGMDMPDGFKITHPHTIVYQCAEDNVADTIKPRLMAAGADCEKVAYKGFNKTPLTPNDRFYNKGYHKGEYYPVRLVKKYDLNKLPKEQTFQMDLECDGEDK